MPFLLELAWRDLRASGRSLWVFFACLVLGVSLVAATAGLHALVERGLLADTRALLGGDLEVDVNAPLPEAALAWIRRNGEVTRVTELDTMVGTERDEFVRVELQATQDNYPLYGRLRFQPEQSLAEVTARENGQWGAAIDPVLAETLGVGIGDLLYVGDTELRIRALTLNQPDRKLSAEWRGAPVLISDAALDATGLVQPYSRVDYEYRVRTSLSPEIWRERFYAAFPDDRWEVRTFEDRGERIAERLGQLASGLLIIGFSTLFIGGLGVFNSILTYLRDKLRTMATLRALGLRDGRLVAVYLLQVGLLSGAASLLGVLIGGVLALAAATLVADRLPMTTTLTSLTLPLSSALLFGMLTAFTFALPALGRALSARPAALFRGDAQASPALPTRWRLATALCALTLVALVLASLPDTLFAVGFLAVITLLLGLLNLIVIGLRRAARTLADHPALVGRFDLRLALANLHRPGAPLRTSLLSLGSALTLLVACTLVVSALVRAIHATIPEQSPTLVLYDVGSAEVEPIRAALHALPGTSRVDIAPLVRARIVAINGTPLEDLTDRDLTNQDRDRLQEAARDQYKLSYSGNNIDAVTVVEGQWWNEPVAGPPRLAMEDREARKMGLGIGDRVTFTMEGRGLEARIAAIYSQKGLQTKFWFEAILSDGALDGFIHRHVGAAYVDPEQAVVAQRQLAAMAPGVITVRTAKLLATARDVLGNAVAGLAVVATVSLAASALVLISVVAASRTRQVYDATVLSALGTRLGVVRRALYLEYLLLALITSLFAVALGSAIAWPLLELRLKISADGLLWQGALTAVLVSVVSLGLGARYLLSRLRLTPATLLRDMG
ncbi:MAG: ABC transporter permease [Gammaproteobacteria bacterium]